MNLLIRNFRHPGIRRHSTPACLHADTDLLTVLIDLMCDSHVDSSKPSSERDLMIDRTLSMSSIRKFLKLWAG
jgi:hypothetical protein